jgi:RNA polymerase sigma-70 factor (ECF subfamily)
LRWLRIGKKTEGLKNSPASSDAQLSERLKQRDEHAFLSLYDLYRGSVYRFLMHMTGSIVTAEELTQDVFVAILDSMCTGSIGQFDPGKGTLEGYLLGIARNLARAERRRASRTLSLNNVLETPEWDRLLNVFLQENREWDVAELMAARSDLRVLQQAILELPNHYREVVVLCSLQERSYRDAAAILQCSEGTIASRMNRAKGLLAAKLSRSAPKNTGEAAITRGKGVTDVGTTARANNA